MINLLSFFLLGNVIYPLLTFSVLIDFFCFDRFIEWLELGNIVLTELLVLYSGQVTNIEEGKIWKEQSVAPK